MISFITGLLFFSIQKNLLVLNFKTYQLNNKYQEHEISHFKKLITLYFWQNEQWKSEKIEILWSQDNANNLTKLIQNWLVLLTEEQVTQDKVNLQAALVNRNAQTAYLSFDKTLFHKNLSTYQKLLIIEGLLKTVRANQIPVQEIQFLVQHQIIADPHLDFSKPWPINGFLKI